MAKNSNSNFKKFYNWLIQDQLFNHILNCITGILTITLTTILIFCSLFLTNFSNKDSFIFSMILLISTVFFSYCSFHFLNLCFSKHKTQNKSKISPWDFGMGGIGNEIGLIFFPLYLFFLLATFIAIPITIILRAIGFRGRSW